MAEKFPAVRWTRIFRPAQISLINQSQLKVYPIKTVLSSIIDKIADLLEMVSSETEIAYCPNNGDVVFIDVLGSDFSDEDDEVDEDDEYLSGDYIRLPTQYEIHE